MKKENLIKIESACNHCPYCKSDDTMYYEDEGRYICLDCGRYFV